MGADLGYIGSAFIATQEANAVQGYKDMIVESRADDIVYTNLFTGVHGNYLRPSVIRAGLDPDDLPQSDPSKMNFGSGGNTEAKYPSMFFKPPNSFVAHNAPILRPPESEQLEYEGEIALVIGKTGRRIPKEHALDWVAGITLCNEGTIRDWIRHGRFNVTQGKAWDSTGSMGPWVATGVDLSKPLHITCKINGEVTQDDTTESMIFKFPDILSYASTFMTLKPGDIICTGTPIKLNQTDGERKWLKAGDAFEMTVPEVGTLKNVVKDEK